MSGYIDRTGKVAIGLKFGYARSFAEGMAPVRIGSKWGYIDKKGSIVIQPVFDGAEGFRDGLARVRKNGLDAYINGFGKYVWTAGQ